MPSLAGNEQGRYIVVHATELAARVVAVIEGLAAGKQHAGTGNQTTTMCRNIKTLHNFKPPATEEEIRASSVQFVRKLSGFTRPSKANELAFNRAVDEVAQAARTLLASLVSNAPPRDREVEAAKARARTASRFHSAQINSAG